MADQETIPIGLETQNKVAEAIYLRWYSNGARHPRPWNEMPMEGKEPWRRVAKDAISTFFAFPSSRRCSTTCTTKATTRPERTPKAETKARSRGERQRPAA